MNSSWVILSCLPAGKCPNFVFLSHRSHPRVTETLAEAQAMLLKKALPMLSGLGSKLQLKMSSVKRGYYHPLLLPNQL